MERQGNSGSQWKQFLEVCPREGVKDTALRWYVVRLERYLKAYRGRGPDSHEAGDVQTYLERAGREASLPGWLFWQLTHALQLSSWKSFVRRGPQVSTGGTGSMLRENSKLRTRRWHDMPTRSVGFPSPIR
jgi:hypothetical protein